MTARLSIGQLTRRHGATSPFVTVANFLQASKQASAAPPPIAEIATLAAIRYEPSAARLTRQAMSAANIAAFTDLPVPVALPAEREFERAVRRGCHSSIAHDPEWMSGHPQCRHDRKEAAKQLPTVLAVAHENDPRVSVPPDPLMMRVVSAVAMLEPEYTLQATFCAITYAIQAHYNAAHASTAAAARCELDGMTGFLWFEYAIKLWLREHALPHPYTSGTLLLDPTAVTREVVARRHPELGGAALDDKVRTLHAEADQNVAFNYRLSALIRDARSVAQLRETIVWAVEGASPLDAYSRGQLGARLMSHSKEAETKGGVANWPGFDIEAGLQAINQGRHNAYSWFDGF